jgi:hypothetical protein
VVQNLPRTRGVKGDGGHGREDRDAPTPPWRPSMPR